ncbi:MAG TPA: type I DNA topoisomerase [Campylobacterales bacterium]|nr:type I DNA topoisomerase [Campylobacterales bacterium]
MKYLIIVESPAKAKTITNFLSRNYKVVATKGHIRDLPEKRFGLEIDNSHIQPLYTISKENQKKLKDIREYAKKAEKIYIATDEDREGEAIGFHTAIALKHNPEELPRIVFHEITKQAILKALKNPRNLDMNLINAQQTRRILDRIVGYKLSPLLSSKIQKGLSAGRVQSSALKIIVDREREIQNFKPQEYWEIETIFKKDLEATLIEFRGEKIEKLSITNEKRATEIYNSIVSDTFIVEKVEKRKREVAPPPPFMTSSLQQSASTQLGFSPKKTMMLAQQLYEGVELPDGKKSGLITYMRTDSLNLSEEATKKALQQIESKQGKKYIQGIRKYSSKSKGAQEAHEAIRPTIVELAPDEVDKFLDSDLAKLYRLIYNRFMASQTSNAIFHTTTIFVKGEQGARFKIQGRTLEFDGFYLFSKLENRDRIVPDFKVGDRLILQHVQKLQKWTEPPHRYSEAGLVKKLESLGIGRPSTYAPTISTLVDRGYISIEKKQITPTEIAFTVTEILEKHFPNIVDKSFTAKMEETLDSIAEGKEDWQKVLLDFYFPFIQQIEKGKKEIKSLKSATPVGRECPECGSELVKRKGRYGEFIGCSSYPKCRYMENIDGTPIKRKEVKLSDEKCPICGSPLAIKEGKNGEFLACSSFPKCRYTRPKNPKYLDEVNCPKCGKRVIEYTHTKKPYYRCEEYPKCRFSSRSKPKGET